MGWQAHGWKERCRPANVKDRSAALGQPGSDTHRLAGHVLTFGRACLSFEREVLADEYPEKDPSTGKLIRDAMAEDVSAHKVCLSCPHTAHSWTTQHAPLSLQG